jgi:hypothetical protein
MAAMTFDLEIWRDGAEEPETVRADQRDMAAFEVEYKMGSRRALDDRPMSFYRWIGWHASRRVGLTTDRFDVWEKPVISVEPTDDEDDEEAQTSADPSSQAQ